MICIPIVAKSNAEAVRQLKKASKIADFIEVRLDFINKPKVSDLVKQCKKPSIFTNRPVREGGNFSGSETDRIKLLDQAYGAKADFIDIELHTPEIHLSDFLKGKDMSKIILSYHNLENTPVSISKIARKMARYRPRIRKIVTHARDNRDNFIILEALKRMKGKNIMFCMGEKGLLSRILCMKCGAMMTYASMDGKNSASGQIDYKLMKQYVKTLKDD